LKQIEAEGSGRRERGTGGEEDDDEGGSEGGWQTSWQVDSEEEEEDKEVEEAGRHQEPTGRRMRRGRGKKQAEN